MFKSLSSSHELIDTSPLLLDHSQSLLIDPKKLKLLPPRNPTNTVVIFNNNHKSVHPIDSKLSPFESKVVNTMSNIHRRSPSIAICNFHVVFSGHVSFIEYTETEHLKTNAAALIELSAFAYYFDVFLA